MGCGAAEADFVCFVVINPCMLSANRVDLSFFCFINFPILLPPPPQIRPGHVRHFGYHSASVPWRLPRVLGVLWWAFLGIQRVWGCGVAVVILLLTIAVFGCYWAIVVILIYESTYIIECTFDASKPVTRYNPSLHTKTIATPYSHPPPQQSLTEWSAILTRTRKGCLTSSKEYPTSFVSQSLLCTSNLVGVKRIHFIVFARRDVQRSIIKIFYVEEW